MRASNWTFRRLRDPSIIAGSRLSIDW
jgi:hypothetical protein